MAWTHTQLFEFSLFLLQWCVIVTSFIQFSLVVLRRDEIGTPDRQKTIVEISLSVMILLLGLCLRLVHSLRVIDSYSDVHPV
jgi:hypothetical protein